MSRSEHIFGLALALALPLSLAAAGSANAQLTVNGEVATSETLSDSDLGGTTVSATIDGNMYSGSSVYSLISDAGFEANPAQAKNGDLLDYLTISNASGQSVVLSEGQIDPNFGGQSSNPQDFIATTENGNPIAPELIVQSDPNGLSDGYDVTDVSNIAVDWASVPGFPTSVLDDESAFTVTGDVTDSGTTYDAASVAALSPQSTQTDTFEAGSNTDTDTFTGPTIFTVLQDAGLDAAPSDPSLLDDYIVVTGSNEPTTGVDDYAVVYSLGEIDPAFNGNFTTTSAPLVTYTGTSDEFRTTAPSDLKGGRYESDLINIQVDSVPEPASLAVMLPGMLSLLSLRRYRRRFHG